MRAALTCLTADSTFGPRGNRGCPGGSGRSIASGLLFREGTGVPAPDAITTISSSWGTPDAPLILDVRPDDDRSIETLTTHSATACALHGKCSDLPLSSKASPRKIFCCSPLEAGFPPKYLVGRRGQTARQSNQCSFPCCSRRMWS